MSSLSSHGIMRTLQGYSAGRLPLFLRIARRTPYLVSAALVILLAIALYSAGVAEGIIAIVVSLLLAVLLIALVWGRGPAIVAAITSSVVFNYYFVPPPNLFSFPTAEELFLLFGLLTMALGLGILRERARAARSDAEQLAASERLQRTLLNSISHDLRAPLTAVMGSLSTLLTEGGRLEKPVREELTSIAYEGTKQLDRLLLQVLEMTRLEARVVRVRREPVSVEALLENVLSQTGEDGRCHLEVPRDLPMIALDPVLISRCLANVLDNALKYSPPGAPITVEARLEGADAIICIADRGIGIPPGERERIFEKFYRIRRCTSAAVHGSGLGLAIAKGIVEAHGGRIWAEQHAGGGTIIKMKLSLVG